MVTEIRGAGTDEADWRSWTAPSAWPVLDLDSCRQAVVVAPHPDDEVLGAGGILALLAAAGAAVTVVAVTDGEGSHPHLDPAAVTARRAAESAAALADLGLDPAVRLALRVPDGAVAAQVEQVAGALARVLGPGDLCFATWRGDGHPDHEAVGEAAALACARSGATLLEYPIWTWHWAGIDDPRVPWHRACVVELPAEVALRKQRAMDRFVSQTEPVGIGPAGGEILPPEVLERFRRSWETVLR